MYGHVRAPVMILQSYCHSWPGVAVDRVRLLGGAVHLWVHSQAGQVCCPDCGHASGRVHSRYERRLADAVVAGRRLVIRLRVRPWFCDTAAACARRISAEQIHGLTLDTAASAQWPRNAGVGRVGAEWPRRRQDRPGGRADESAAVHPRAANPARCSRSPCSAWTRRALPRPAQVSCQRMRLRAVGVAALA
jgi:zinc-finger of transposase IS204/IS1001/IS1096/IS1165